MSTLPSGLAVSSDPDGVVFWIHVTPRARKPRVGGLHADALRVQVAAPPVEGKANAACTRCLADALAVSRGAVQIDPGSKSRRKRVRIAGDPNALRAALELLAQSGGLG